MVGPISSVPENTSFAPVATRSMTPLTHPGPCSTTRTTKPARLAMATHDLRRPVYRGGMDAP